MDFAFFDSLAENEARTYLQRFLDCESAALEAFSHAREMAGIKLDYRAESLAGVLKRFASMIRFTRIPVPATEPEWIRQAHGEGLVEFDDATKAVLLRAAYYLGETFVRSSPKLAWAIGQSGTIEKNMPVVAWFEKGHQLAPIMVIESVFVRIAAYGATDSALDTMVEWWRGRIPHPDVGDTSPVSRMRE